MRTCVLIKIRFSEKKVLIKIYFVRGGGGWWMWSRGPDAFHVPLSNPNWRGKKQKKSTCKRTMLLFDTIYGILFYSFICRMLWIQEVLGWRKDDPAFQLVAQKILANRGSAPNSISYRFEFVLCVIYRPSNICKCANRFANVHDNHHAFAKWISHTRHDGEQPSSTHDGDSLQTH